MTGFHEPVCYISPILAQLVHFHWQGLLLPRQSGLLAGNTSLLTVSLRSTTKSIKMSIHSIKMYWEIYGFIVQTKRSEILVAGHKVGQVLIAAAISNVYVISCTKYGRIYVLLFLYDLCTHHREKLFSAAWLRKRIPDEA